jgi:hypothetical protein
LTRFTTSHQNKEEVWLSLMLSTITGIDPIIEESTLRKRRCMIHYMAVINLRIDLAPLKRKYQFKINHLSRVLLTFKLNLWPVIHYMSIFNRRLVKSLDSLVVLTKRLHYI